MSQIHNQTDVRNSITQHFYNCLMDIFPELDNIGAEPENMCVINIDCSTVSPARVNCGFKFTGNFRCNKESNYILPAVLSPHS